MLMGQNRIQDAVQVGENAVKAAPENQQFRDLLEQLRKMKKKVELPPGSEESHCAPSCKTPAQNLRLRARIPRAVPAGRGFSRSSA